MYTKNELHSFDVVRAFKTNFCVVKKEFNHEKRSKVKKNLFFIINFNFVHLIEEEELDLI